MTSSSSSGLSTLGRPHSSGVSEAKTCCSPTVLPKPSLQVPALHLLLASKKEKKKSQIMLSSRSLSPHLCQSPDKRSHYFKTPADVCLSFVMSPRAAAIAVAPLIGAPTVPAACLCHTRDSSSSSFGLQADRHMSAHIWIQVAPESNTRLLWEGNVFQKPALRLL